MKYIFTLLTALFLFQTVYGVGNSVIKDLEALKAAGFIFRLSSTDSEKLVSLTIYCPAEYNTRPKTEVRYVHKIAYIETINKVEPGPKLIGAASTRFPLSTATNKGGGICATVTVRRSSSINAYLAVFFRPEHKGLHYDKEATHIVHIPVASIIIQLEDQAISKEP